MPFVSMSSLRPLLTAGLPAFLVGALVVSGCTSPPKAVTKPTAAPTTAVARRGPTPIPRPTVARFTAKGVPADLAAVIKLLYLGGTVRSSPSAGKVLGRRKVVRTAAPVVVHGAVAAWKGVPIAVVTKGKDVTLAVKAPGWKVVGGWWPSMGVRPSLGGGPRRVLMVGSDARPGQSVERSRADSLHIVAFDGHGSGGVLGIARDSYVPLASGGRDKINAALALGGPRVLEQTVASLTGVSLDGYLITGFGGFKALVNGIGGLRLNAPVAVRDAKSSANVKAGRNRLSGVQALSYGRARYEVPGGDFGRSANQGLLIKAAADFARAMGPRTLPGILRMAGPKIGTNLSAEQVLTFAAGAYVTPSRKVHNRVATGSFGTSSDGQSIVLLSAEARRMFADIRDGNLS